MFGLYIIFFFKSHTVFVCLLHHLVNVGVRGVAAQRAQHGTQLLLVDRAAAIFVEQREGILQLCSQIARSRSKETA